MAQWIREIIPLIKQEVERSIKRERPEIDPQEVVVWYEKTANAFGVKVKDQSGRIGFGIANSRVVFRASRLHDDREGATVAASCFMSSAIWFTRDSSVYEEVDAEGRWFEHA